MNRLLYFIIVFICLVQLKAFSVEQDSIMSVNDVTDSLYITPDLSLNDIDPSSLYNEINIYFNYFDEALPENERLANKVEAYLNVNNRIGSNSYQVLFEKPKTKVNPFIYEAVPFKAKEVLPLELEKDTITEILAIYGDTIQMNLSNDFSASYDVINAIAIYRPDLMTITWNQLPDPPKISDDHYLPLINDIKLEMKPFEDPFKDFKVEGIAKKKKHWGLYGTTDIGFSQYNYTYWEGAGKRYLSILGKLNYKANYKKNKTKWRNLLELRLGIVRSENEKFERNEDFLHIESRVGHTAVNSWDYSFDLDIKTQMFNGDNDTIVAAVLSQSNIKFGIGMNYAKKKFSLYLSPLSTKLSFKVDTTKALNLRSKADIGGLCKSKIEQKLMPNVIWKSKLDLFFDYNAFPGNIIFDWENGFEMKVNHLMKMSLTCHLKYNEDAKLVDSDGNELEETKWQFKEFFTLGVVYAF